MLITVIILTFNEEKHIERCIKSVKDIAESIFLVDSFSNDRTIELAEKHGAIVYRNKWPGNQALQFNWALENLPVTSKWVLRLDADEYITKELADEIRLKLPLLPNTITGIVLPLERIFQNRILRNGTGTIKILRLFRFGKARYGLSMMDEHLYLLEGNEIEFVNRFVDHNLNGMDWWSFKHIGYAKREAVELLNLEFKLKTHTETNGHLSKSAESKRLKKMKYAKKPLFWRSVVYFLYRYFIRGGFLEGKEGYIWHFFQGLWYRSLVDALVYEMKRSCANDEIRMKTYIKENFGYEI